MPSPKREYYTQLLTTAMASPEGLVVTLEGRDALRRAQALRKACYRLRQDRNLMLKIKWFPSKVELHIQTVGRYQ